MNAKLSILFYAKRAKTTTDGLIPIYIRVTVDGERIELSTKRFTTPEKWSVEGSCMKGYSAEAKSINSYLDSLKAKVYDYQQQLIREDKQVNAENMRNKILGVEKRSHMLIGIFQQHNEEIKALVGHEFATATYTRYETSLKHTVAFLNWKYKVSFLFSCFTGLAYVDVKKLSRKNIGFGVDGERWIFINRTKTDTRSNIPILPIASFLLEKYEDHPQVINQDKLLPILSNQKMNSYLKEIADACGINKELTFHIARQ